MENSKIIKQNQKSIGFIDIRIPEKSDPNKNRTSIRGTGFIISKDGVFATNAHVYLEIPENEKQFLGFNIMSKTDEKGIISYSRYQIELLKLDKENDLALFRIKSSEKTFFEPVKSLGDLEKNNEGDEMLILGFPLATEMLVMGFGITSVANQCIISAIKRKGQDGSLHFFLIDTHVNLGASGSPIFSKNNGEVVGIVSGRIGIKIPIPNLQENKALEIPANMGICRPVNYLKDLINN